MSSMVSFKGSLDTAGVAMILLNSSLTKVTGDTLRREDATSKLGGGFNQRV
jgi:hypothetical protein